jgi:DNA-binding MarR family transcriptional regulator
VSLTAPPSASRDEDPSAVRRALAPNERAAWFGLLCAHSTLVRQLDAELVARHNLTLSAYEVLARIAASDRGMLRISDLAEAVLLSPSRVSRLVASLEERSLLERRDHPEDSRAVNAAITERGRELVRAAERTHCDAIRSRFLHRLSPLEVEQLGELWRRVAPAELAER